VTDSARAQLNNKSVDVRAGETILALANRHGVAIPTLCHDSRLDPAGACRSCLVEVEGRPRLVPACATPVLPGMRITTESERITRHRQVLLALYLSDLPQGPSQDQGERPACEVDRMAADVGAATDWPKLSCRRATRKDSNPFVGFIADRCILCARCVRYCDEVEAVSALTLVSRGARTTIATGDNISLLDSTCEMCGGCIDVCPTGAMFEKLPREAATPGAKELLKVRTTCNYCGVGCQLDLNVDPTPAGGRVVKVTAPDAGTIPNDGNLCVKGRFGYEFIHHEDRLRAPLVRADDGVLREASWDEALERAATGLTAVSDRHGSDSLGFVSSSRCTGEENYLMQKLARAVFGTNNVHQCAAT